MFCVKDQSIEQEWGDFTPIFVRDGNPIARLAPSIHHATHDDLLRGISGE
jgi:hypothetical protein